MAPNCRNRCLPPKEYGPDWSHCVGIEYKVGKGEIPSRDDREAIAEIVGFILGRRLLNVGHTTYNRAGLPLMELVTEPLGIDIIRMCQQDALPPINFDMHRGGQSLELLLGNLIPVYLQRRTQWRLDDAVWRFDMARALPIGIDLPVFSAAVEGVANQWLNAKKAARQYLGEDAYHALIETDLTSIDEKLRRKRVSDDYRTVIMNKLRSAWRAGQNESPIVFFERAGIKVGALEKKAMAARSPMVHGARALPKDIDLAGRLRVAYQIIFTRMVLKLLGYNGSYIDYATPGCPARDIDDPPVGSP